MNATDLVTDFYKDHPTAIRSCIKAMETTEEDAACPANQTTPIPPNNPSSSSACSSETQPSSPSHTASKSSYQPPGSLPHYSVPSISPSNTPSCTTVCANNNTAPSTTDKWHSIQTYLAQNSPCLPSLPLEQKMESHSSEYTPKKITYTSSLPSSEEMTSQLDSTGPVGSQGKKEPSSITMELMSQLTVKNQLLAQQSAISATSTMDHNSNFTPPQNPVQNPSHQDTRPYIHRHQKEPPWENTAHSTLPLALPDSILQMNNILKQNRNKKQMTTATLPANTLKLDFSPMKSSLPLQRQKAQHLKEELRKEVLKSVIKDFTAMDDRWKRNSGKFQTRTLAIYFRKLNKDTALYLLCMHPQLYFTTTNLLKGRGLTLPNPSQAKWAHFSLKHHKELRTQLACNHVETIPLGGASCYNPPYFSPLLYPSASTPKPLAKPLSVLPPLPPSNPSKDAIMQPPIPLPVQPPVKPLVPIPWNIHCREYSSMEMYQEPPPVENLLEDPDSPMEDTPPLEPEPVTHYEPDVPRGQTHTLSPESQSTCSIPAVGCSNCCILYWSSITPTLSSPLCMHANKPPQQHPRASVCYL